MKSIKALPGRDLIQFQTMSKIILVSAFADFTHSNSRISNIFHQLHADDKHIISVDFDHSRKVYKTERSEFVHYIHVPSYSKNLSVKRLYSHIIFAIRLRSYLKKNKIHPEALYCTMPTILAAYLCGRYCKKNKIRFIIDVIDIWPDSLVPISFFFKYAAFMLYPWKLLAINTYKLADYIIGESKQYVSIAKRYNKKAPSQDVYLGIDLASINKLKSQSRIIINKPSNEIWIGYGGSLGNSYDFDTLLNAININKSIANYKLLLIGDGVNRTKIEAKIKRYKINALITGYVSYMDYLKYLSYCDIGVNIFKAHTKVVHSYKFNDYVASNLFILNNLQGETSDLIDEYNVGLNFDMKNKPLDKVLRQVLENWEQYAEYCSNNAKLISDHLDKRVIYSKIESFFQ